MICSGEHKATQARRFSSFKLYRQQIYLFSYCPRPKISLSCVLFRVTGSLCAVCLMMPRLGFESITSRMFTKSMWRSHEKYVLAPVRKRSMYRMIRRYVRTLPYLTCVLSMSTRRTHARRDLTDSSGLASRDEIVVNLSMTIINRHQIAYRIAADSDDRKTQKKPPLSTFELEKSNTSHQETSTTKPRTVL